MPATSLSDAAIAEHLPALTDGAGDLAAEAVERLRDAEARFSSAFENSGIGMTITSLDGRYVRVNRAFARLVGRPADELVGMHVDDVTHPDDRDSDGDTVRRLVADPALDVRRRKRYVRPGGREVWASLTVSAVPGPDGAARYLIAQMIDISEQRAAEIALADSERRFRTLAVASPVGIFAATIDGSMMYANQRMTELFGTREGEVERQAWLAAVSPDGRQRIEDATRALQDGRASVTVEVELRDGERWVRIDVGSVREDAQPYLVGTVTEVTSEVRARAELAAREAEFRLLAEHSGDFLSRHDLAGRFLYASPACVAMLGLRPDELLGRTLADLGLGVDGDDRNAASAVEAALCDDGSEAATAAFRIVRPDGEVRWLETAARLAPHGEGDAREIVAVTRDVTDRKAAETELAHRALHDALTGLPNRTLFLDRLEQALRRARRLRSGVAVLFVDLDRFKLINDSFGHAAGDRLLCDVAARLREQLRPADTIARFGGDELTILCEDVADEAFARAIAGRIAELFEEPFLVEDGEAFLQASVGIAVADAGADPEGLIRDADAAMYRAKETGRARVEVFDEAMRADARDRVATESALRRAIGRGELRLHVQPVAHLASGRIRGFEALVRWEHPERGMVAPGAFIPLAEETGLIVPIGEWVLRETCRTLRYWREVHGLDWLLCSVNLSVRNLQQPDLADTVRAILDETGVDAAQLVIEITESVMEQATGTADALRELKALGVRLALDDFGTGYSSLARLHQFPFDILKVDRSFVAALSSEHGDATIAEAILSLGRALGLATVAEGIEDETQLRGAARLGCGFGQGFHLARPAPAKTFDDVLRGAKRP